MMFMFITSSSNNCFKSVSKRKTGLKLILIINVLKQTITNKITRDHNNKKREDLQRTILKNTNKKINYNNL